MADIPDSHVITGDPFLEKANLNDIVLIQGFQHIREAGRAIIRDKIAMERTAVS
ncbi:hypothetical protein [Sphingobium sp. YG1]|uniref:hypothetical protein n=1 Tax=Sphingobium sp. YG1 TaxID=2082188 RepID=UPI0015591FEE|nr:hypothetical protein [Sphingobium sp. YG1]